MKLTTRQSYELLEKHGSYITEICDACGKGIGPICFKCKDSKGVWCSRQCRDGENAHTPGTCKGCGASVRGKKRGTKWCSDTCRDRDNHNVLDGHNKGGLLAHSKGLMAHGRGFGCPNTPGPKNGLMAESRAEGAQR